MVALFIDVASWCVHAIEKGFGLGEAREQLFDALAISELGVERTESRLVGSGVHAFDGVPIELRHQTVGRESPLLCNAARKLHGSGGRDVERFVGSSGHGD